MSIFSEQPESDFQCSHICHRRGLNPWVRECPTCGCSNPAYDPAAVSDIEPRHDALGLGFEGALALLLRAKREADKKREQPK